LEKVEVSVPQNFCSLSNHVITNDLSDLSRSYWLLWCC